jgi:hypothetical protein
MPSVDLREHVLAIGVSDRTYKAARKQAGVIAKHSPKSFAGGEVWYSGLPDQDFPWPIQPLAEGQ